MAMGKYVYKSSDIQRQASEQSHSGTTVARLWRFFSVDWKARTISDGATRFLHMYVLSRAWTKYKVSNEYTMSKSSHQESRPRELIMVLAEPQVEQKKLHMPVAFLPGT